MLMMKYNMRAQIFLNHIPKADIINRTDNSPIIINSTLGISCPLLFRAIISGITRFIPIIHMQINEIEKGSIFFIRLLTSILMVTVERPENHKEMVPQTKDHNIAVVPQKLPLQRRVFGGFQHLQPLFANIEDPLIETYH